MTTGSQYIQSCGQGFRAKHEEGTFRSPKIIFLDLENNKEDKKKI